LTKIEAPDVGYSPSVSGSGFLPLNWNDRGAMLLFQRPSARSDTMRRLVQLGAETVPNLLDHLTDARPTQMVITHPGGFGGMFIRVDDGRIRKDDGPFGGASESRYTVTVGDLCYVALGQIVNRPYTAVRYQPTAIILVTSVAPSQALVRHLVREWGEFTAEKHRVSLEKDLADSASRGRREQASVRLAYYYPDSFEVATLKQLAEPVHSENRAVAFVHKKLFPAKDAAGRKSVLDAYVKEHGPVARGVIRNYLFSQLLYGDSKEVERQARECLVEVFGFPPTVSRDDRPKESALSTIDQARFVETLVYDRSPKIDRAVRDLFVKTDDGILERACLRRLVGRGFDADIEEYLKRKRPAASDREREDLKELEDKLGWSRLHQAVDLGLVEIVDRELKEKVPVDARARDGRTALHLAAAEGKADAVETLLAAKADVTIEDATGRLAVQLAAQADYPEVVRKLVEKGSRIPDAFVAATVGNVDRLAALLKLDPDQVKSRNDNGLTPLLIAAREGHAEAVRLLLDAGAKVTETDDYRETKSRQAGSNG
jgi:hypothetical protein